MHAITANEAASGKETAEASYRVTSARNHREYRAGETKNEANEPRFAVC
jgi:hypothetical protein